MPNKISAAQKLAINFYRAKLNLLNVISTRMAANEALDIFTNPNYGKKKRDPPVWKYAEKLFMDSEYGKLAGFQWKAKSPTGKKLLIVHGFAGDSRTFDWSIKPALAKGYDVYVYDAPAHGKSGGKRLNASSYMNVIEEIIKRHNGFDAYMAHSLGGLCLMLALNQLQTANHPKIILIAPATESTTAADNFFAFLQLPKDLRVVFEKKVEEKTGVPLQWFSITRVLNNIKGNILWLHDEDDLTTPVKDVYPLMEQQPQHVHFHFTKGLGHSGIYKDNKVKKLITAFLD